MHHPNRPSHLPALGTTIADKATRDGVAARGAEAAVHQSLAVARALLTSDDAWRRAVARTLLTTAQPQEAHTRSLRHTVPGIGTRLRRVWL